MFTKGVPFITMKNDKNNHWTLFDISCKTHSFSCKRISSPVSQTKQELHGPFLKIRFTCQKAMKQKCGDRLVLIPNFHRTHFINLRRMGLLDGNPLF